MGLRREIWINRLVENLFKDNSFVNFSVDETSKVIGGVVVHRPQAGALPNVVKNRRALPAQVNRRQDTDTTYLLSEFSTDPDLITDADKAELNYSLMDSILYNHTKQITETAAEDILYSWLVAGGGLAAASTTIRTSGSNVTAHVAGATNTRKAFKEDDLQKARKQMDKDNIPKEGRYAIFDADMWDQFMTDIKTNYDLSYARDVLNGSIPAMHGFTLLQRSTTISYDNAGTPVAKLPTATGAATDNGSVICWQKDHVAKAMGTVKVFDEMDSPIYYGDIFSALVRVGGAKMRTDAKGILAIVQTS